MLTRRTVTILRDRELDLVALHGYTPVDVPQGRTRLNTGVLEEFENLLPFSEEPFAASCPLSTSGGSSP